MAQASVLVEEEKGVAELRPQRSISLKCWRRQLQQRDETVSRRRESLSERPPVGGWLTRARHQPEASVASSEVLNQALNV